MHFCHEKLIDLALFAPAKSCCDKGAMASCQTGDMIGHKSHCKDESIVIEPTDDYVDVTPAPSLEYAPAFDLFLTASVLFNFPGLHDPVQQEPPWHKEPPPFNEVVLSKIQTYLI